MAIKSSLRLIARRIAEAVKAAAAEEGILPGDYLLRGSIEDNTDRVNLTFATDRKISERAIYSSIRKHLREAFTDYPQIVSQIGVVIRGEHSLDDVNWEAVPSEDETDITSLLELP
jgi:hypothetical protein